MDGLDQIGSALGDFIYAALHPSVANLPAGFLVLVFAVLMITALPEGARERMRLGCLAAAGLEATQRMRASVAQKFTRSRRVSPPAAPTLAAQYSMTDSKKRSHGPVSS